MLHILFQEHNIEITNGNDPVYGKKEEQYLVSAVPWNNQIPFFTSPALFAMP